MKGSSSIVRSPASPSRIRRIANRWAWILVISCLISNLPGDAQQESQQTFATPGDAVLAMYTAVKTNNETSLTSIFGRATDYLAHSGDEVADRNMIQNFLTRYNQMHRIVVEPDGTATLYIGSENWPFPVSLDKDSSGRWYFDIEGGKLEILYRRIGRNENDAIEICRALVEAQKEYASSIRNSESSKHYALKFISDEGKQNGLFWNSSAGEPHSPIGPLIAQATSEGYSPQQGKPTPFHGYYFRILTRQGNFAKGGKKNYIDSGELVHGFAFLAYPAEYRNSGVMTFMVNQNGIVYQRDLGPDTETIGRSITQYNPDSAWERADD